MNKPIGCDDIYAKVDEAAKAYGRACVASLVHRESRNSTDLELQRAADTRRLRDMANEAFDKALEVGADAVRAIGAQRAEDERAERAARAWHQADGDPLDRFDPTYRKRFIANMRAALKAAG